MKLYHVTSRETALLMLDFGFRDSTGDFGLHDENGVPLKLTGVWLSDQPLTSKDGEFGDTVLEIEVDLTAADLERRGFVVKEDGYREWLMLADLLGGQGRVRLLEARLDEKFVQASLALRRNWLEEAVRSEQVSQDQVDSSLRQYEASLRSWKPE